MFGNSQKADQFLSFVETYLSKYNNPQTKDQILDELKSDNFFSPLFKKWFELKTKNIDSINITPKDMLLFYIPPLYHLYIEEKIQNELKKFELE
ncbi:MULTISPECIES: hypothetical protein [unclassified Mycoplasma]|uniref:hypothetical protein n=1 Tax=unclassified Mycoplasma TaxID=2683645 RepID=UPI00211C2951|nr:MULTISPECIES: hypothetical protein [unclassified Mycoplasma]UUM19673.1 hypothetical protein NPA11_02795 [Mycoplasma sp. 1578d]UUM24656.1 hypothetical protein NPA12_03090 [Mycoplasma sp. 3686d]